MNAYARAFDWAQHDDRVRDQTEAALAGPVDVGQAVSLSARASTMSYEESGHDSIAPVRLIWCHKTS